MKFLDTESTLVGVDGKKLVFKEEQEISDEHLDHLQDLRNEDRPFGDGYVKVASVPVALINKWIREGFDFYHAPITDIMDRLRAEELTKFLATRKRI